MKYKQAILVVAAGNPSQSQDDLMKNETAFIQFVREVTPAYIQRESREVESHKLSLTLSHLRASRLAITTLDRQQPPFPLIQRERRIAEPPVECQRLRPSLFLKHAVLLADGMLP